MNKKSVSILSLLTISLSLVGCNVTTIPDNGNEDEPTTEVNNWNEELINLLNEYADGLELPYYNFGADYTSYLNDSLGCITVSTSNISTSFFDDAKEAFDNDAGHTWSMKDDSIDNGYTSYTYSTVSNGNNHDVEVYIKNKTQKMDIYTYPSYEDDILDYLRSVNANQDVLINKYEQSYYTESHLYEALELAGDIEDSKVTDIFGVTYTAKQLDNEALSTVSGIKYDNNVYNATGREYVHYMDDEARSYDGNYRINNYLKKEGLFGSKYFENYQGHGEYKIRELGIDREIWDQIRGKDSDEEYFYKTTNIGQFAAYSEQTLVNKVTFTNKMNGQVIHNEDETVTCRYEIIIEESWRESFGIYGILNYPHLTEEMDVPSIDRYVSVATFNKDGILMEINMEETQTLLASQITNPNSPWYGKEDFVVKKLKVNDKSSIITAGNYEDELLFDLPITCEAKEGNNTVSSYEYIYGTLVTFTAPLSGKYTFTTTDPRCQLDFIKDLGDGENFLYYGSCDINNTFVKELSKDEELTFRAFFTNEGQDNLFVGDVTFNISKNKI